jgi:hypothetical protein
METTPGLPAGGIVSGAAFQAGPASRRQVSLIPSVPGTQGLYYVSIKELLPTITGLITLPPGAPPPAPVEVTPKAINAGAGENFWPSGIANP